MIMVMIMGVIVLRGRALPGSGRTAFGGQYDGGRQHAIQVKYGFFRFFAQGFQLGTPFRVDFNGEGDVPILDLQAGNHVKADDILLLVRIIDGREGVENPLLIYVCHP